MIKRFLFRHYLPLGIVLVWGVTGEADVLFLGFFLSIIHYAMVIHIDRKIRNDKTPNVLKNWGRLD